MHLKSYVTIAVTGILCFVLTACGQGLSEEYANWDGEGRVSFLEGGKLIIAGNKNMLQGTYSEGSGKIFLFDGKNNGIGTYILDGDTLKEVNGQLGDLKEVSPGDELRFEVVKKVNEGLQLTGTIKLAVTETFDALGRFPSVEESPDANSSYGLPLEGQIATLYSSGIAVLDSGVFRVTYNENLGGNPSANGLTILFKPTIDNNKIVKWDCSGGTLMSEYRPPLCS